jgi:hypothetical protein
VQEMFLAISVALSQGKLKPRHRHVFGDVAFDTTDISAQNKMYIKSEFNFHVICIFQDAIANDLLT